MDESTGQPAGRSDGLRVEHLTVRFGGLVAVDDVSLEAPTGRLTGLIGPNGAGKTTMFNACTGVNRPTSGVIHLFGEDVSHASPQARARKGLGRTFQRMELFDSLKVRENIALGKEAGLAGSKPWRHFRAGRAEQRATLAAASDAMEMCGITHLAEERPSRLPTGQRRLVELARAIAGGFTLLLLDEPSSGLDKAETARFGEILRHLVANEGKGILVVEHDMALVMSICEYIYVLDFGELIFQGTALEVSDSEIVRAAYLGSEAIDVLAAPGA